MTHSLDGQGPAALRLTPLRQDGRTVVTVAGELDLGTAGQLPDLLRAMAPDDCRLVHLDLTGLDFIDVVGLAALCRADEVVRDRAGRMTIGGLRPLARRLIDLTALPLTIEDDTTSRPGMRTGSRRDRPDDVAGSRPRSSRGDRGYTAGMEPLPEVRAGAERLASLTGIDVLDSLDALAALAVSTIPSCVGVSLTVIVDGQPFTMTSTSGDGILLDATQYLDGGPCVEAARTEATVSVPDVLDERRWQTYSRAAAALGIRSSLSLPIWGAQGQTPGAMNFYAADPDAFSDGATELAAVFQVPVGHLISNADLGFMTKQFARELPERLEAKQRVDTAIGMLMQQHGWNAAESRTRLQTAATHAGTTEDQVATLLLGLYEEPPAD